MSTSHRLGFAPTLVSVFILFLIASSSCDNKPKSYLDEIKDAVFSMRSFLNAGLEGLGKLAKTIETVEQFVDATIDEDCEPFTCPKGYERKPEPYHTPISNGCGSFGIQWKEENLPHKELEECCDDHDFCYDECGADKDMCDLNFKKCLYRVCLKKEDELSLLYMKACKGTAKLMYTGTLALGCKAYQDAQRNSCRCTSKNNFQDEL